MCEVETCFVNCNLREFCEGDHCERCVNSVAVEGEPQATIGRVKWRLPIEAIPERLDRRANPWIGELTPPDCMDDDDWAALREIGFE